MIESGDYDKFDSDCNQTMVGFIHPLPGSGQSNSLANHQVHCFQAVQSKHYDIEKTEAFNNGKVKYNKIVEHHNVQPESLVSVEPPKQKENVTIKKTRAKKRQNLHLEHKPSDQMDLMITAVNTADLGWKADVCKYQKHHELYGSHCDKPKPVTLAQVNEDEVESKPFGDMKDKEFKSAFDGAQKYMRDY